MDGSKPKIDIPTEKIAEFCRKWKIKEFSLFGSMLREDFRPDSDVDVMVSFNDDAKWSLWDLGQMREELIQIFGREVDLVEKEALQNPFRRNSIMRKRKIVYAT